MEAEPQAEAEAPFGHVLRVARMQAGMTQEDLAARSGISVRAISDLERGYTGRPYFRSVRLLADGLGASASVRAALLGAAGRAHAARAYRRPAGAA
jgi:transcriptional regulator with XRE-family HTH domain